MRGPVTRRSRINSGLLLVGIVVCAVLAHGCAVFAAGSFPPFLPYVSGEVELSGQVPSSIRRVSMDTTITPAGGRYFAILAEPDGPDASVLVVMDEELAGVTELEEPPLSFDSRMLTRIDGAIQIGTLIYDSLSGEVRNGPGPTDTLQPIARDLTNYWALRPESDVLVTFDRYDGSFVPGASWSTPAEAVTPVESIRAVEMHERSPSLGADGEFVVFVLTDVGLRRTVLSESDFAAETGFPIDSSTGVGSQVFPVNDLDAVRETPAGILVADGGRLTRYDRTTGAKLDEFDLGQDERSGVPYTVAFDPEGEFYLLFDAGNRALFRVEPWW